MQQIILGTTLLGNWEQYKPVYYRLYYQYENQRRSMVVASRLGFLTVAVALSHLSKAEWVKLYVIAPITLSTVGKKTLKELEKTLKDLPYSFCNHVKNGIERTSKIGKSQLNYSDQGEELLVVDRIEFEDDITTSISQTDTGSKIFPGICNYKTKLSYSYIVHGDEAEVYSIKGELKIISVPLNFTERLQDDTLVIMREKEVSDQASMLASIILKGLELTLLYDVKKLLKEKNELKIKLFYDTTHGVNTLIPPFSRVSEVLDAFIGLILASQTLRNINNIFSSYSFESYIYNSDPIRLRGVKDDEYLEKTREVNLNFYYRLHTSQYTLSSYTYDNANNLSEEIRKQLNGLIKKMVKLRAIIDEIVSNYTQSSIKLEFMDDALAMYLLKIGLVHWAILSAITSREKDMSSLTDIQKMAWFEIRTLLKEKSSKFQVLYNYADIVKRMRDPFLLTTAVILWDILSDYLIATYNVYLRKTNSGEYCFNLDSIKNIMASIEHRLTLSSTSGQKEYAHIIAVTSLYQGIIEPVSRIIMFNELDKISSSSNLKGWLKSLLHVEDEEVGRIYNMCLSAGSRGFKILSSEANLGQNEDSEGGIPSIRGIRNFVAHGGLTSITNNLSVVLKNKNNKCIVDTICLRGQLEKNILARIVKT